jgi:hypothetical protein
LSLQELPEADPQLLEREERPELARPTARRAYLHLHSAAAEKREFDGGRPKSD